jgi:hypothetical protein
MTTESGRAQLNDPAVRPDGIAFVDLIGTWTLAAFEVIAHAGTWTRDGDLVHHQVEVSLIPDWIGTTLVRTIGEWDRGPTLTVQPNRPGGRAQRLAWAPART